MNCIVPSSILIPTRRIALGCALPDEADHCGTGAMVSISPVPARSAGIAVGATPAPGTTPGTATTVAGGGGGVTTTAVGTGCAWLAQAARTATATRESGKLSFFSMEISY